MKDKLKILFKEHETSYANYIENKKYNFDRIGLSIQSLWIGLFFASFAVFSTPETLINTILSFILPFFYFFSLTSIFLLGNMKNRFLKTKMIILNSIILSLGFSILYYFIMGLIITDSKVFIENAEGLYSFNFYNNMPVFTIVFPLFLTFILYYSHIKKSHFNYEAGRETANLLKIQNEIKMQSKSIKDTLKFINICNQNHFDKTSHLLNVILSNQLKREGFKTLDEYLEKNNNNNNTNNVYSF